MRLDQSEVHKLSNAYYFRLCAGTSGRRERRRCAAFVDEERRIPSAGSGPTVRRHERAAVHDQPGAVRPRHHRLRYRLRGQRFVGTIRCQHHLCGRHKRRQRGRRCAARGDDRVDRFGRRRLRRQQLEQRRRRWRRHLHEFAHRPGRAVAAFESRGVGHRHGDVPDGPVRAAAGAGDGGRQPADGGGGCSRRRVHGRGRRLAGAANIGRAGPFDAQLVVQQRQLRISALRRSRPQHQQQRQQ